MEIAMLVIASLSAIMQGIQTWQAQKDAHKAAIAARNTYEATQQDPRTRERAAILLSIVPEGTLRRIYEKLQRCYTMMNEMFDREGEKYFPDQISEAARGALRYCVCDSLQIMRAIAGELPDEDLREAWVTYNCEARIGAAPNQAPAPAGEGQ